MDILRFAVVGIALVTLASLPCLIAWVIVNADAAVDRVGRTAARLRPHVPARPPVEEIAARLRTLAARLEATPLHAAQRRADLLDAYDATLRQACAAVEVPQYLSQLNGDDLHLERVRVEGSLEQAGLRLRRSTAARRLRKPR
ncbi:MAG: hypothetical protein ACRDXX_18755 [Stackebrandtia sp.]